VAEGCGDGVGDACEELPAALTTTAATEVKAESAILNGVMVPGGSTTSYETCLHVRQRHRTGGDACRGADDRRTLLLRLAGDADYDRHRARRLRAPVYRNGNPERLRRDPLELDQRNEIPPHPEAGLRLPGKKASSPWSRRAASSPPGSTREPASHYVGGGKGVRVTFRVKDRKIIGAEVVAPLRLNRQGIFRSDTTGLSQEEGFAEEDLLRGRVTADLVVGRAYQRGCWQGSFPHRDSGAGGGSSGGGSVALRVRSCRAAAMARLRV
jgi:hypothetical protein